MNKKIIISVTCFDNEMEIVNFAKNINKQNNSQRVILVITCNRSCKKDWMIQELKKIKLQSYVYEPNTNMGYLHGCLYGLKKFERIEDYEWVMISNTDITFKSQDFFSSFVEKNIDNSIFCVAPKIVLSNGKYQNPFLIERPKNIKILFWRFILGNKHLYKIYNSLSEIKKIGVENSTKKTNDIDIAKEIYAAHGSCFFIRKGVVDESLSCTGNENIFMYGEEIFIAEIIRKLKKKVIYYPDLYVNHNENSTTSKIDYDKKSIWYKKSYRFIYKSFFKNKNDKLQLK